MAKGDGTIAEILDKDGKSYSPKRWRVQVYFGRNPVTGRYDRATETVRGTKADAVKARDRLRQEREHGIVADGLKMTFSELADKWLGGRERMLCAGELSQNTVKKDRIFKKELVGIIGNLKLKEITPIVVRDTLDQMELKREKRNGRKPSGSHMRHMYTRFSQIMQLGVDYDLIYRNPVKRVKAPRQVNVNERKTLTREQAAKLLGELDKAEQEQYIAFEAKEQRRIDRGADEEERAYIDGVNELSRLMTVRLALVTGMRRGEILGLTWEHVDLKKGVVSVVQSLDNETGKPKAPKTKSGYRNITIDVGTVSHLAQWRVFQRSALSEFGVTAQNQKNTPVCCSGLGGFGVSANLTRWWSKWRAAHGFDGLLLHELRHTQATLLFMNGADAKTIETRLGHSSASITLDMYTHALPENDRKAAELIGSLFGSKPLTVIDGGRAKKAV